MISRIAAAMAAAALLLTACSDSPVATRVVAPDRAKSDIVPGDYVVTNTADAGPGSLRQAVLDANAAGTAKKITFAIPSSDPGCSAPDVCTIGLASEIAIANTAGITVDGAGQSISVSGKDASRVFYVGIKAALTVQRLSVVHGNPAAGVACPPYGPGDAGGAFCNQGTLTIIESTVAFNQGIGAAVFTSSGSTLNVSKSTLSAAGGQSLLLFSYGYPDPVSITLANTMIDNTGGVSSAMYVQQTSLVMTNTTLNNNGRSDAALVAFRASVAITSSTLVSGANLWTSAGKTTLTNSILVASRGDNCAVGGGENLGVNYVDGGGNISLGGFTCPGLHVDPKLGPLQLNAPGSTTTFALLDGSPAIGAAVPASCPVTDQRGVTRPHICDIGAYESPLGPTDATPPVIAPTVTGTQGLNSWYTSSVTVSWSVSDGESAVSSAPCSPVTISVDTPSQVVTCEATSDGGTSTQSVTIKRDATPPTLAPTVSPNPVLPNATATASANASDNVSGVASSSCGAVNTATLGQHSVECMATDRAGNTATLSANYTVSIYAGFTGFLQPVDPMPVVNVVKGGSAVDVKFGLGANLGLAIFAAGYPASQQVACATGAQQSEIDATASPGTSILTYDATTQLYLYTWKTEKAWSGTCRTLALKFTDGSSYQASFKFK